MTKEKEKGILLESGTNELEIATFKVGKGLFAINVAKIQSIETQLKTTKIPNSHDHVKGIVNHRGNILPVINLSKVLGEEFELQEADRQVIVAFFNEKGFAFEIDKVMGINRLSWKDVETPSELYSNSSLVTGVIKLDDKIILSVDFEKIVVSLSGKEYNQGMEKLKEVNKEKLAGKQIIVAEDSPFLSKIISDSLGHTGAEVSMFNNGEDALQYIESIKGGGIFCLVSDIEMPKMDGLTLTKEVKKQFDIPVVLFSSIISDDLRHKGESVGADAQITKPEIHQLVETIVKIGK